MEASSTDKGNTSGTKLGILNSKNLTINIKSRSLPANSEMKSQTVWRIKINKRITNTVKNVVINDFKMYLSRIFTSD